MIFILFINMIDIKLSTLIVQKILAIDSSYPNPTMFSRSNSRSFIKFVFGLVICQIFDLENNI